ncbi:DEAD/DEAH box helicase family protein, partial [candidate division WOR-3 bacterium]|nr:DEAD/DEAH box helicase family protein [candidate division WOR-3 bacterium]
MNIDFDKLVSGNTADSIISPRVIFHALPNKVPAFDYLRDVQAEVLEQWFNRRTTQDLVIKMNIGSGKTLVGLLILKSCINEKHSPALYVAADPNLVKQVIKEASDLGIKTTEDPRDISYLKGESICVINIYKLINGKSVFGVGNEGIKIDIISIIVDDAHACLSNTVEQFTLK